MIFEIFTQPTGPNVVENAISNKTMRMKIPKRIYSFWFSDITPIAILIEPIRRPPMISRYLLPRILMK